MGFDSKNTVERLRALTQGLERKLAAARHEHVVKVNTIATEMIDMMQEYTRALEAHVEAQETELTHYRTWEDSREVAELVEMVKKLEVDKAELTHRLADVLLTHVAQAEPKQVHKPNPADSLLPLICV